MNSRRARYENINSLAKLREEQMRLSWEIKQAESNIRAGYYDLRHRFSLTNLLSSVFGRSGNGGIVTSVASTVYSVISSWRRRRKRRS